MSQQRPSLLDLSGSQEKMGLLDDRSEKSPSELESESSYEFNNPTSNDKTAQWLPILAAPAVKLGSLHWRQLFVRFLIFLIPSFLQGRIIRDTGRPAKLFPTSYLDGMRGLASLFVYFCHYSYQAFTIAEGYGCGETNYHILKLPFLRLWYQGPAAVCVFFVISGYALSYRPIKLIRSGQWSEFSNTISSLTFRRLIRLYLPPAISTLMVILFLRLGLFEYTRQFATDRKFHKNIMEPHPWRMETTREQLSDWASQMFKFVHIWDWGGGGGRVAYDVHLWTIPIEYRCSLYLFLVIVGTARLQTRMRLLSVFGIFVFTYWNSRWDFLLFLAGMLLAENDLIRGAHDSVLPKDENDKSTTRKCTTSWFWDALALLGLYLLGQPDGRGEITPGWIYLTSLIPTWWGAEPFRYWQGIGAVVFIYAVAHSSFWQRFFNSGVVQYFGKISYAIYLMHGPAMHIVGYHFENWAYSVTGLEGYQYNAGFFLGACFCIPTVIWWADIFWRAVDIPTVKFAKWFESKCVVKA
ncbi:unnamed protein product [Clonostachys rhizophaga]|uniref:Acyltransferase 3 domain-containing protein n=1 Tax=Clonostachys rhizophaga TaxID=160324 RepID=A0A9N9YEF3_9HYPO|nr:unnamed protein product [Clonostachys rhizophaga]